MTDDQWIADLSRMLETIKKEGLPGKPKLREECTRAISHIGLVVEHMHGPQGYAHVAALTGALRAGSTPRALSA